MEKNKLTVRNSSVEVLRIMAMLFIVLSHSSVHGGYNITNMPFAVNRFWLECSVLGNLGVDIFILISGYFLCEKNLKIETFGRLFAQVWFYSILLFLIANLGFGVEISLLVVLKAIFPTVFAEYWFFTAYIILLFITPLLNEAINNMTNQQLKALIVTLSLVWIIVPTFTRQEMYSYQIEQFMLFYIIGAYFKKYPESILVKKWARVTMTITSFVLLFGSTLV